MLSRQQPLINYSLTGARTLIFANRHSIKIYLLLVNCRPSVASENRCKTEVTPCQDDQGIYHMMVGAETAPWLTRCSSALVWPQPGFISSPSSSNIIIRNLSQILLHSDLFVIARPSVRG